MIDKKIKRLLFNVNQQIYSARRPLQGGDEAPCKGFLLWEVLLVDYIISGERDEPVPDLSGNGNNGMLAGNAHLNGGL